MEIIEMKRSQKELLAMKRDIINQAKAIFDMKQQEFYSTIGMIAEELGIKQEDIEKYSVDPVKGIFIKREIPPPAIPPPAIPPTPDPEKEK